ncbi:hypothetical protein ACPV5S_08185 [Vibrio astriarenae]
MDMKQTSTHSPSDRDIIIAATKVAMINGRPSEVTLRNIALRTKLSPLIIRREFASDKDMINSAITSCIESLIELAEFCHLELDQTFLPVRRLLEFLKLYALALFQNYPNILLLHKISSEQPVYPIWSQKMSQQYLSGYLLNIQKEGHQDFFDADALCWRLGSYAIALHNECQKSDCINSDHVHSIYQDFIHRLEREFRYLLMREQNELVKP